VARSRRPPDAGGIGPCARPGTALAACLALLLAGCIVGAPGASGDAVAPRSGRPLVTPWLSLTGARLAPAADATGTPSLGSGPLAFHRFVHPTSAAVHGNDVYIADSGAGAVFRFDIALGAMTPLKGIQAHGTTRVFAAGDFSLYVLDAQNRRVQRFARSGQLLATYGDGINLVRPVDIAVDDADGRVLVADGAFNQLVAFHPLGRASYVVPLRGNERNRVLSIGAIAIGRDALYVSDPACRCIARVARDGTVLDTFGHQVIGQPGALAVDRHRRVFVADRFDRSLKVFMDGRLIFNLPAAALGLQQVGDLRISEDQLALADGAGARVELLRIAPPQQAPSPTEPR